MYIKSPIIQSSNLMMPFPTEHPTTYSYQREQPTGSSYLNDLPVPVVSPGQG